MYKKLLVPLDGSQLAEKALARVPELSERLKLDVVLLYVAHPDQPELLPMYQAYIEHEAERMKSRHTARVRGEVAGGYAANGILLYAEQNGIDLIMISSHGRTGLKPSGMGTVAGRVLRGSRIPVWLARAGRAWPVSGRRGFSRILIPLDGSLLAEEALPPVEAIGRAGRKGSIESILLRVSEPPAALAPSNTLGWSRQVEEHLVDAGKVAENYLNLVGERMLKANLNVTSDVVTGEPATQILEYAQKSSADLIALASHGHSGFTRWAFGNVAGRVVEDAPCDVLLIRPLRD